MTSYSGFVSWGISVIGRMRSVRESWRKRSCRAAGKDRQNELVSPDSSPAPHSPEMCRLCPKHKQEQAAWGETDHRSRHLLTLPDPNMGQSELNPSRTPKIHPCPNKLGFPHRFNGSPSTFEKTPNPLCVAPMRTLGTRAICRLIA
jgi:hypothetical protein